MADLYQDFAKVKILLTSAYEELLKSGRITEEQFESVLEIFDTLDGLSVSELHQRLQAVFNPKMR